MLNMLNTIIYFLTPESKRKRNSCCRARYGTTTAYSVCINSCRFDSHLGQINLFNYLRSSNNTRRGLQLALNVLNNEKRGKTVLTLASLCVGYIEKI